MNNSTILQVENLKTVFSSRGQEVQAVRGVSFEVNKGEIVGLVGESGSGKSVTMKAILGILPENAKTSADILRFQDKDLLSLNEEEYRRMRGKEMTMIFQDPMTALNPLKKIGAHLEEVIMRHSSCSKAEAKTKAIEMLRRVGIPMPETRMKQYPHEFSGGMRQRVLIAMALACEPELLIADEPTTALDVTIQAQILDLLREIQMKLGTATILVSHDLGVVARVADRVAVMYAGKIVEIGTAEEVYYDPRHPYTWGLMRSLPAFANGKESLYTIPGMPPTLIDPPKGDAFACRNEYALNIDYEEMPPMFKITDTHYAATWLLDPRAPQIKSPVGGTAHE